MKLMSNVFSLSLCHQWCILSQSLALTMVSLPLQRWPEAEFNIVHDAGHSAKESGTTSLLVKAADKYAQL